MKRAQRVASRLETGRVSMHDVRVTARNPSLPSGGVRPSVLGAYHGQADLKSFSNEKPPMFDRLRRKKELQSFSYDGRAESLSVVLGVYFGPQRLRQTLLLQGPRGERNLVQQVLIFADAPVEEAGVDFRLVRRPHQALRCIRTAWSIQLLG